MSNIKDKLFNASQKIIRAVFHGAPNLFTAPDINRQLAAFDYRFQQKERYLPVIAKMSYEVNFQLEITYSYIELAGTVLYDGPATTVTVETNVEDSWFGAGIWIKKKLVTYDTDGADHLISGAVFEDGTSMSAADHYVISDWGFCYGNWTNSGNPYDVEWFGVPKGAEVVAVPIVSKNPDQGGWERADNFLPPGLPLMAEIQRNIDKGDAVAFEQSQYTVDVKSSGNPPYTANLEGSLVITKNRMGVVFTFSGTLWWNPNNTVVNYGATYTVHRDVGKPAFSEETFFWIKDIIYNTVNKGVTIQAGTYILQDGSNNDKGYIEATVALNQDALEVIISRDAVGSETMNVGRQVSVTFQIVFLATK